MQVDTLHTNHDYDIIVFFHKSHARGDTWDCFGTPGVSKNLLDSKAGASLKNIFRLGILNEMANVKADTNSSNNNTNLTSHTSTSITNTHTNVNPLTIVEANIMHTNPDPITNINERITHPISNTNSTISINFNSKSTTKTSTNTNVDATSKSNSSFTNSQNNLNTVVTNSNTNVSTNPNVNTNSAINDSNTNIACPNVMQADPRNTANQKRNVVFITAGKL